MGFDETSPRTQYDMDLLLKSWFYMYIAFLGSQTLLKENHKNRQIAIKDDIEAKGNPLFSTTIALPPTAETYSIPTASTSNRTQRTRTQIQPSPTTISPKPPIEIYTAYTRTDEHFFLKIEEQLDILHVQGWPISCHKDEIINSTEWQRFDHLETANLILLLISSAFLKSKFCYCEQMHLAVERHKTDNLCYVIPIIIHPLSYPLLERTPFGSVDFLPTNGKAISDWRNSHKAYKDITDYLIKKMESMAYYL